METSITINHRPATRESLQSVCNYFQLSYEVVTGDGHPLPVQIPRVTRQQLLSCLSTMNARVGVEVGVASGRFSKQICYRNPALHLHLVDICEGDGNYGEGVMKDTIERVRPYSTTIHRQYSVEAAKTFADRSLDFVYLDASHRLPDIITDMAAWIPKIRSGGIIAGHDYHLYRPKRWRHPDGTCTEGTPDRHAPRIQVKSAVDAWTSAYNISPWFILGEMDAIGKDQREPSLSWFWVV